MVTDPIADLLTRLKNAARAKHPSVTVPFSKLKLAVAETLARAGYVKGVNKKGKKVKKYLEFELVYTDQEPKLTEVRRVSKSSRRVYHGVKDIKSIRQGFGVAVYSTPKGVLTDKEARTAKVGGEILATIW